MKDDRRDPPPFEIPDLELPVAPSRPVSRVSARSAEPRLSSPEPEHAGVASGPIAIEPFSDDSPSGPHASPVRNVHDYFGAAMFDGEPGDAFQPGSAVTLELQRAFTAEPSAGSEWPTGRSPERSALSMAPG